MVDAAVNCVCVPNTPEQPCKVFIRHFQHSVSRTPFPWHAGARRLTTLVGVRRNGRKTIEFRRSVPLNGNEGDSKEPQRHQRSHTVRVPTPGRRVRVSQRMYSKLCWPCKHLYIKYLWMVIIQREQSHIRQKRTKTTLSGTNITWTIICLSTKRVR